MTSIVNIRLLTYFILVSAIGTLGNGIILLAYGNRWNSSKSTSVVFILILACFDLWTCLITVPTIAILEYRDFDAPTFLCRFNAFSKNLIIISPFIMSLVAIDRFLNIALPHYRLLTPRRVKVLLTLFIIIGIGLSILASLAFSTVPYRMLYDAYFYYLNTTSNENSTVNYEEILLGPNFNGSLIDELTDSINQKLKLPNNTDIKILEWMYKSTENRCFADTSIISEAVREVLKHIFNKFFFFSIGVVTIFYSITFVLALRRQKPRIQALKKSLNILTKFDTHESNKKPSGQGNLSVSSPISAECSPLGTTNRNLISTEPATTSVRKDSLHRERVNEIESKLDQSYELVNLNAIDENGTTIQLNNEQIEDHEHEQEARISIFDETSDDLQTCNENLNGTKRVAFLDEQRRTTLTQENKPKFSISSASFDNGLPIDDDIYYKVPYPCSKTRELLIKFHFTRPVSYLNRFICCCCYCCFQKKTIQTDPRSFSTNHSVDEESTTMLKQIQTYSETSIKHSETLKKQLHQHRLKQIRMALTFLLITVSFVFFYLPSTLNAERIIESPMTIYYLYLCTHVLNPLIYCFMHPSLRTYVISMFRCRSRQMKSRKSTRNGPSILLER